MRKLLKSFLRKLFYQKYYNWWDGLRGYFLENKDIKLTKEEKKQIDTFYSKFTNLNLGYTLYKVFKSFDKFDIKYIPDTLYYSYILRHLNPMSVSETFANKGIYGYYFKEVNRPKELVRKINGNYIDYNNDIVTEDAAIEKILSYDWEGVVAKPSIDSGCGKGIKFITNFCKTLHEKLPFCCIVGWDVALDENNKPLLVEVNLKEPAILYEQLCTGPIFGERTDEVIDYVTRNGAINMWIKHFRKS